MRSNEVNHEELHVYKNKMIIITTTFEDLDIKHFGYMSGGSCGPVGYSSKHECIKMAKLAIDSMG